MTRDEEIQWRNRAKATGPGTAAGAVFLTPHDVPGIDALDAQAGLARCNDGWWGWAESVDGSLDYMSSTWIRAADVITVLRAAVKRHMRDSEAGS